MKCCEEAHFNERNFFEEICFLKRSFLKGVTLINIHFAKRPALLNGFYEVALNFAGIDPCLIVILIDSDQ